MQLLKVEVIENIQVFVIGVPSKLHEYWINNNCLEGIFAEISALYKKPFNIQICIESNLNKIDSSPTLLDDSPVKIEPSSHHEKSQLTKIHSYSGQNFNTRRTDEFLNPDYTFDTFVVGKNNEFAHAASYNIAQNPGSSYNPLFICGPVGMGKTHLLIAAGNHIRHAFPHLRVTYVSIDRFINECIVAIRDRKTDKFRQKYREDLDVLLVDDIQGLKRGESVQEEFFNTLNELFNKRKQVIVASDRIPREILGLEDRIRSRLEWGLIVNIQMPDFETRVAILRYKAEKANIRLQEDVINYIARISKTSIRELEGNLNRLKVFAELQGLAIDMELAKKVLAIQEYQNQATIEDIQKIVADYYKIKVQDLKGTARTKTIVYPRQICMYLIEKHLGKSLSEIGRAFGGKDHTTVMHARDRISNQLQKDFELKRDIEDLSNKIHNINGL